jgi:transposase
MTYFIGIDLHKKTSQVAILGEESDSVFIVEKSIRSWPRRFEEVLAPYAPAHVLVEASTVSRWVAPYLRTLGHVVVVADPNYQVMYASRQANCKNDQTDARALAFACRHGHFRAVYEPTEEQRPIAELLGTRSTQVRRRTAAINRVRALYAARGVELGAGESDTFWARVKSHPSCEQVPAAVALLDELAMLEDLIRASEKKLDELAASHAVTRRLMTVPGVGSIVALAFYAKLGNPTRFGHAHEVASYLGLVPKVHASAEPGHGGRLSKKGSDSVRALMVQAAWSHINSSSVLAQPLKESFLRIQARRSTGKAIVAIARRLVGILYAMWRDGTDFERREPKPLPQKPAQPSRRRRYQLKSNRPAVPPV